MRDAVRRGVLTTRTPRRFTSRCAAWASSRDVRVSPLRGRARLRRVGLRHVEEVPDEDGVVVRAAHDLKLVELKTENTTRMFLLQTRKRRTIGVCTPQVYKKTFFLRSLTTRVLMQSVPGGDRGSMAASKSQTLILL